MPSRALIVVGGGSSTRFGDDKLLTEAAGAPLISHTIAAVAGAADVCVVVCRPETMDRISSLHPRVVVTAGGATRTASEIAGLAALDGEPDLIGIHDAARPAVSTGMVRRLFDLAAQHGGAVPVLLSDALILDRATHLPVPGLGMAQTPQVFRGPALLAAYAEAAETGFEGDDTVEVMERFGEVEIVTVPGDRDNIKVTYPADLERVRALLSDPSRT